jgi:hypothetical protein
MIILPKVGCGGIAREELSTLVDSELSGDDRAARHRGRFGKDGGGDMTTDGPAVAKGGLPWWAKTLVVAVGIVLLIGWRVEDAAVARLQPPRNAWFGGGTATVSVTAGEARTVYWDLWSIGGRGVKPTAQCTAMDLQSGSELALEKVGTLRVGDIVALATMRPTRTGPVALTCSSMRTRRSAFALGTEVPPPGFLNGVANYSGNATSVVYVIGFLISGLIVFSLLPVRPAMRVWVFRFWAPLLIAALLVFPMNSVWDGFLFWLLWFGIGSLYWRGKKTKPAPTTTTEDAS